MFTKNATRMGKEIKWNIGKGKMKVKVRKIEETPCGRLLTVHVSEPRRPEEYEHDEMADHQLAVLEYEKDLKDYNSITIGRMELCHV